MPSRVTLAIIGIVIVALVAVACGGGSAEITSASGVSGITKPSHYGVFIRSDKQLVEAIQFKGSPSPDANLPTVADSQPTIVVWLQNLVLDYVVILDNLGSGKQVAFTAKPVGDEIVELQAKSALAPGTYCLVKGSPLASPADVPYYCFQVGSQASVGIVPTTKGGQPTPNPGAMQTAVAAAATQLINPANAATQSAAVQTIKNATATVEAARALQSQAALGRFQAALQARSACTNRVRPKIQAGDYSEIRPGADLMGCDLSKLNLFGMDFSGVNLSFADLQGANLKGAKFSAESNLERADLRHANLEGVDLSKARTRLAVFTLPLPEGVSIESVVRNVVIGSSKAPVWVASGAQLAVGTFYDVQTGQATETNAGGTQSPVTLPKDTKLIAQGGACEACWVYARFGVGSSFGVQRFACCGPGFGVVLLSPESDVRDFILWDAIAKKELLKFTSYSQPAIRSDGKQVAADVKEGIVLFNAQTGAQDKVLMPNSPSYTARNLRYSPDGRLLAIWSRNDRAMYVFDISTGKIVLQQVPAPGAVYDATWTSTNRHLIVTQVLGKSADGRISDGISIWDIPASRLVRSVQGGSSEPEVGIDPHGNWVGLGLHAEIGSARSEILLVNINDGTDLGMEYFAGYVKSVVASPDGKYLAVGWDKDRTIRGGSWGSELYDDSLSIQILPVQALMVP